MPAVRRAGPGRKRPSWLWLGPLALLGVTSVLAVGCGDSDGSESDDEKAVAKTMRSYFTAIIDSKGEDACELLTSSQQRRLPTQTPKDDDCIAFVDNYFPPTGRRFFTVGSKRVFKKDIPDLAISVKVEGDRATARAGRAKGQFGLIKQDGRWKISNLGL
jgi:hypothetical protein